MNILVTGACGYKGTVLIPKLLDAGHNVVAVDVMWFGNYLEPHINLSIKKNDIRNIQEIELSGIDVVIHLAAIANDPAGDLNPKLTWEVNTLATMQLIDKSYRNKVKHFIYASSGSVYGIKQEINVTEELTLLPITEYNKTKMVSERVVLSYMNDMCIQVIRPATVCGLSKRMRLDVSVNILTMQALMHKKIKVLGGDQTRPNIHIDDITDLYLFLINRPDLSGIYNAGFENISIKKIAEMVCKKTEATINIVPSNDPRSYRMNSDKLLSTGFMPKRNVELAITEICSEFESGNLKNSENFYSLEWMKKNLFQIT